MFGVIDLGKNLIKSVDFEIGNLKFKFEVIILNGFVCNGLFMLKF